MEYLIMVDYQSDAERKRIDYAIERWKERGDIHKPKGTIIHYSGDEIDEFLDDIYSRLGTGKDAVHVFAGDSYSPTVVEQTRHLEYSTGMEPTVVGKFLNYIMNKLGASFDGNQGEVRCYTAYTKKGQVGVDISLTETDGTTGLLIIIRGYGEVVAFIAERIDKELKVFLE